ncbi:MULTISPECIES: hypothetical protein [unclassified Sphingomonas]|uniref:hypothetical protein n=1 Tax=Sphingomonas TaxID=13687 RepID=UPI001ACD1250|nr:MULTISPECIES: hypothetical protein [unclassified Sphingomonas]MBN8810529.1 hypothetical protein [Sphingomonas sp.]
MTSISSIAQRMDARIAAAASAGTISADDRDALRGALGTIDSSLASDHPGSGTGGMKGRIDGLIDAQTRRGALTDDQAAELRRFFAEGPDGGPGSPPPSGDEIPGDDTGTPISEAAARRLDAMSAFLQKLRDAAASGTTTYGGNAGTRGNGDSATGWVIDRQA